MCIELWLLCTFTPSIVQRCKVQTGWLKLSVDQSVSACHISGLVALKTIQKLNESVTFLRSVVEPHLFSPNVLLFRGDDFVEPITSTQNFKKTQRSLWTTLGKATAETCLDSYVTLRQKPSKMSILRTIWGPVSTRVPKMCFVHRLPEHPTEYKENFKVRKIPNCQSAACARHWAATNVKTHFEGLICKNSYLALELLS